MMFCGVMDWSTLICICQSSTNQSMQSRQHSLVWLRSNRAIDSWRSCLAFVDHCILIPVPCTPGLTQRVHDGKAYSISLEPLGLSSSHSPTLTLISSLAPPALTYHIPLPLQDRCRVCRRIALADGEQVQVQEQEQLLQWRLRPTMNDDRSEAATQRNWCEIWRLCVRSMLRKL